MKSLIRPRTSVSRRGIAEILGVSKQRVFVIEDDPGFPRPVDCLDGNPKLPYWRRADVVRYAKKRRAKGKAA